jgi:opacity protein-like surface antigen
MRVFVTVFAASLSFALTAGATEAPKFGTYLGYDWVNFNPDTPNISTFHANGGSVQFQYNFSHGIGAAFDAGEVSRDTLGGILTNRQAHFLVGPRYGYYNHSRFTPFVEVLFGAAEGSVSLDVSQVNRITPFSSITLPDNISVRLRASRTSFAMMAGGGLDIRLSKHFTYRLFDADYYLCRPTSIFTNEDVNRNNVRLTTGVNFTWGAR